MLHVKKIDTYYDEFRVLKEVSLSVSKNELVLLLGPNGHGKSTLLKTICGSIKPSVGTIEFKGHEIHHLPIDKIVEMGLVHIPEDRHLFTEMTVLENLKLGAYNRSAWPKLQESLAFVFDLFPRLGERKKQIVSTLSGGELRMLAIGRGLMAGATFLAIDEPSLGLSPILTKEVFKKIEQINGNKITILLVEQNVKKTAHMADHIYLLQDGRITFTGTQQEALENPTIKDVFLGQRKRL
jgi:branched-chain amino acid transport system ATP-binding protein